MADDSKKNYPVGYAKPPRNTRFKKGQSGNPAGRPKGSPNVATVLEQTLSELVVVNENGRRKTISKLEAAVKQLVNKAAAGDARALQQLLGLVNETDSRSAISTTPILEEADRLLMQSAFERIRNSTKGDSDDKSGN